MGTGLGAEGALAEVLFKVLDRLLGVRDVFRGFGARAGVVGTAG